MTHKKHTEEQIIAVLREGEASYWNMGIGSSNGDVEKDEEGIRTMTTLVYNMAWLLKKLK